MSSTNTGKTLSELLAGKTLSELLGRLKIIDKQSPHSNLIIYEPSEAHAKFYYDLCLAYLSASDEQRALVQDAVRNKEGLLNNLLGYIYVTAEQLRETKDKIWLQVGLATASMRGDGPDYRDFLLALAELYVAADDVGLDPKVAFMAIGGGVPANFHTYAVLMGRLANLSRA